MTNRGDTVFIVEDDAEVRDSFAAFLEANGMETRGFPSGEAFLTACGPHARGCLLLDINLPGMSGIELLEALREQGGQIPAVVITGRGDEAALARARAAGAAAVFRKPLAEQELLAMIRTILEHTGPAFGKRDVMSAAEDGRPP